ncbi:MAG: methyltransferase domain-containing protein [Owenweeksia sp.]|nr:methyltransferase domain-containing protein [Owenweeksia sp.]
MIKSAFRFALNKIPRPLLIRLSYWARPVLARLYHGHNFEDPIDGRTYKKMLPYGYEGRQRENALAPGTLSLERHRLMWLYLKEETDFFTASHKVLHVAPEQCFYGRFRKMKNLDYLTSDLDSPIADVKMDIHNIKYPDDTFDVVFCNHVLEHVTDDIQCMSELCRVLTPGGLAIMQVPLDRTKEVTDEDPSLQDPEERKRRFGQYDHLRLHGRDYPQRLQKAGFKVREVDYSKTLTPEQFNRYRLPEGEILYVCTK